MDGVADAAGQQHGGCANGFRHGLSLVPGTIDVTRSLPWPRRQVHPRALLEWDEFPVGVVDEHQQSFVAEPFIVSLAQGVSGLVGQDSADRVGVGVQRRFAQGILKHAVLARRSRVDGDADGRDGADEEDPKRTGQIAARILVLQGGPRVIGKQ